MPYRWIDAALAQLLKEGVEPYEVMQVLLGRRPRQPLPGRVAGQVRVLTIRGRTAAGRALLVMMRHEGGRDWVIIGARDLVHNELLAFEEWEKDHGEES